MLIIPSAIILVSLRKDYQHSIPWFLSSLSLLVNAIADDGYVNDFVNGNSQNLWIWNLIYVTDFIIMAGALFWYNKFHISNEIRNARIKNSKK
jgi:cytochrome b subunit of formate dehydrogenase